MFRCCKLGIYGCVEVTDELSICVHGFCFMSRYSCLEKPFLYIVCFGPRQKQMFTVSVFDASYTDFTSDSAKLRRGILLRFRCLEQDCLDVLLGMHLLCLISLWGNYYPQFLTSNFFFLRNRGGPHLVIVLIYSFVGLQRAVLLVVCILFRIRFSFLEMLMPYVVIWSTLRNSMNENYSLWCLGSARFWNIISNLSGLGEMGKSVQPQLRASSLSNAATILETIALCRI